MTEHGEKLIFREIRACFFLQLLVGLLQFLLTFLQFGREGLRLLEKIFRPRIDFNGVKHDADTLSQLLARSLSSGSASEPFIIYKTPCCAETSGASSDRINLPTVSKSRWPCSMRVNLVRFVFSQFCSSFRNVVSFKLRIISLMLSFTKATSPRASTWIERVRSPLVTAVATSAIARS